MQTRREIQSLLHQIDRTPNRRFGQCFLVDLNFMRTLLELAELTGSQTVLEVGAGTGSLTEELILRARHVVAVEIDRHLAALLEGRFAAVDNLTLIEGDALAAKSCISPTVLTAVAPGCQVVANLPYNIATPLVAEMLGESWRSRGGHPGGVRFERMTFTVQKEVADRFVARTGSSYGPVSVLLGLLGEVREGPVVPAGAFWPAPKIASRILRVDFHMDRAAALRDLPTLRALLHQVFSQRRKHIIKTARARGAAFTPEVLAPALERAGIAPEARVEDLPPETFGRLANLLAGD
jgi:16S rRNA (adenine1518-N6/adenine1519-N6)-dimethyltransferase